MAKHLGQTRLPFSAIDNRPLLEQAAGLDRSSVMKSVVGPALTAFFGTSYDTRFTGEEIAKTSANLGIHTTQAEISGVLKRRWRMAASDAPRDILNETDELLAARPELSPFFTRAEDMFDEAVTSSVYIPTRLAFNIFFAEHSGLTTAQVGSNLFGNSVPILERDSFGEILSHFAKGPNGFLGSSSAKTEGNYHSNVFSFADQRHPEGNKNQGLKPIDAFVIEDGKVTKLSDAYHAAARARRKQVRSSGSQTATARDGQSSGCPVRHSFQDTEGTWHESLIARGHTFTLSAIRAALGLGSRNTKTGSLI